MPFGIPIPFIDGPLFAAKAASFFTSKRFLIPAAIIALLLSVGGGTYLYLNHQTNQAVAAAVTNADATATIQTMQGEQRVQQLNNQTDTRTARIREQSAKDYANVSDHIQAAPLEIRQATVPSIIIDTINELDRLRTERENASGVPAPQPSGR